MSARGRSRHGGKRMIELQTGKKKFPLITKLRNYEIRKEKPSLFGQVFLFIYQQIELIWLTFWQEFLTQNKFD